MKRIITAALMFTIMLVGVQAQDFGMSTARDTAMTIFVGDVEVSTDLGDVFKVTKGGSIYLEQVSKRTGNSYPTWISQPYKDGHEYLMHKGFNHQIRVSNSGNLFILAFGKSGNIYCKYIRQQ
jgi:hypothetical protein